MEDEVRGSLYGIAHKGECLQDPEGGPFCMLCGAFSGRIETDKVSRFDLEEWSRLQNYSKMLKSTQVVLGILPLVFILLDNMFGWTGLSYFDYKLPSRRGIDVDNKYIDLINPVYLIFIAAMALRWTYVDREYLRIFGNYNPFKVYLIKMSLFWSFAISIYALFYPIFQESRKYLTPLPQYSSEQIALAYERVYLALLFLIVGFGIIVSVEVWIYYYIRHKIKDINERLRSVKVSPSPKPRFEEGWG